MPHFTQGLATPDGDFCRSGQRRSPRHSVRFRDGERRFSPDYRANSMGQGLCDRHDSDEIQSNPYIAVDILQKCSNSQTKGPVPIDAKFCPVDNRLQHFPDGQIYLYEG